MLPVSNPNMHARNSASSADYVINNLHLQASQVIVDSALMNSFKNLLASGRSLSIAVQSIFTQAHIMPANSSSAQISMLRALSKLGLLFLSYTDSVSAAKGHEVTGFANPSLQVGGVHADASNYSHTEFTLETQAQLDSFLFPETKMDSLGEHFAKLQEAASTYDQKLVTLSITPEMYSAKAKGLYLPLISCAHLVQHFLGLTPELVRSWC